MQTIIKQNIISLQSNGQHCLCTIWHPSSDTAGSGHLNTALVQTFCRLLEDVFSHRMFSSARQQRSDIVRSPRREPTVLEQDDLHLRTSKRHGCNICTSFPRWGGGGGGNREVVFSALEALE